MADLPPTFVKGFHDETAVRKMSYNRLGRTNHLAQIKYLDPDAYIFEQRKMLNPGSHTKYDYYQLVITPNVQPLPSNYGANEEIGVQKLDDDNIVRKADTKTMNPQIMIARYQRFQQILLDRVKHEHDIFLRNLLPPMIIPKEKVHRWHAEFNLEGCPDILPGALPQPPNIEKFSSPNEPFLRIVCIRYYTYGMHTMGLRYIFVTENKGVLEMDKVMAKLENSFREKMTKNNLRELLEIISKEAPRNWLTFHFIGKTDFIKINRHENLAEAWGDSVKILYHIYQIASLITMQITIFMKEMCISLIYYFYDLTIN